jgi:hypothetical protein
MTANPEISDFPQLSSFVKKTAEMALDQDGTRKSGY